MMQNMIVTPELLILSLFCIISVICAVGIFLWKMKRKHEDELSSAIADISELHNYKMQLITRLIKQFQCDVGDTVYYVSDYFHTVLPIQISEVSFSKYGTVYHGCHFDAAGDQYEEFDFDEEDFGKDVFVDEKLAEATLKTIDLEV